jgi:hypothetical protein
MSEPNHFQPPDFQLSKFRFYSLGIVAANKPLATDVIDVIPVEELTMLDGEINTENVELKAQGVDASGRNYTTTVQTNVAIRAKWLKLTCSNRMTSPDVRRGASVIIYQFGDSDSEYYWTTWKDDSNLRKLETVVWGISATKNEADNASSSNMYYFEISSHTKTVTFHTSQANGEQWGYDIQINTDAGYVTIQDTAGNIIRLNSAATQLLMQNVNGTTLDIQQNNMSLTVPDTLTINAKNIKTSATNSDSTITNITTQATQLAITAGNMTTQATSYALSAETGTSTGNMSFAGDQFEVKSTNIELGGA